MERLTVYPLSEVTKSLVRIFYNQEWKGDKWFDGLDRMLISFTQGRKTLQLSIKEELEEDLRW